MLPSAIVCHAPDSMDRAYTAQQQNRYTRDMPNSSANTAPKYFLEAAIETALEAGKILREEYVLPPDILYKGDVDLVTQADKRSETAIVTRLSGLFPEHTIAAEEGTGHVRSSEFHWHVDPLDGTTNFAHKYPCFAVSIALAQDGTVIAGVVYNPIYDELFAAARGEGAALNGRKISVSKIETLSTSLLCTGFPVHKRRANPNIHYYYDFTLRSHGVRRDGSAALDLACVAAGRFDGFWEFGLQAWDTAAGVLLVQEAGGAVSDFQGHPYALGGPVILATNALIHEEMRATALAISRRDPSAPLQAPAQATKK
jgi:myo-inositol-1(or 4)-monophosphatase